MSASTSTSAPGRLRRRLGVLRALARVELRSLRRHRARSWLVALLVAVPVAALVGGGAWISTTRRTQDEAARAAMGQAQLRVDLDADTDARAALADLLGDAPRLSVTHALVALDGPGRRLAARLLAAPAGSFEGQGLAAGLALLTTGRWPATPAELAVSPTVCAGLGVGLGEQLDLAGVPRTLVGTLVDPEQLDAALVVLAHPEPHGAELLAGVRSPSRWLLVGTSGSPAADDALAGQLGVGQQRLTRRAEVSGEDALLTLMLFVVGGFGLAEAALVVAAAFAVGLRRRQRELGLLGASGADARDLTAGVLLSALALACAGCLLGALTGLAVAHACRPWLDGWTGRLNGPLEVDPTQLVAALGLGLAAAVAAAWWPARAATRRPLREALAGRRPAPSGGGRWLLAGLLLAALGLALVAWGASLDGLLVGVLILAGSALGLVGFGVASPGLLGLLARRAAPLPLAWRLAVRDAGRFRARHGPVVSAVLAGMALSVTVAALLESVESATARRRPQLRDDVLLVEGPGAETAARALAEALPVQADAAWAAACQDGAPVLARLGGASSASSWLAWGDPALLTTLGLDGETPFAEAEVLVLDQGRAAPTVTLAAAGGATLAARAATTDQPLAGPAFVVSPEHAARRGWQPGPPPGLDLPARLVRLSRPVDGADLAQSAVITAEQPATRVAAALDQRGTGGGFYQLVLLVCLLTGLVVIAIATALTAVESAADAQVLHCVGADPGLLHRLLAARAAWLALLGCLLAIPAGLLPAYGLMRLAHTAAGLSFVVPWVEIVVAVAGLPLLAYAGTWTFARWHARPPGRAPAAAA